MICYHLQLIVISLILSWVSSREISSHDSLPIGESTLWMEVEWVLQSTVLRFDGFFTEFLGYAPALKEMIPLLRLTKSFFKESLDESPLSSSLLDQLFPNEWPLVSSLLSSELPDTVVAMSQPPTPMFPIPSTRSDANDQCEHLSATAIPTASGNTSHRTTGTVVARQFLTNASSSMQCCQFCQRFFPCMTWSFDENETVIFHGTTCNYLNETVLGQRRDINTILIARLMLERSAFTGGLSMGDYSVIRCAAFVDEVWVPTEWHRAVFRRLLAVQGVAHPTIIVVPEVIETSLFHPLDRPFEDEKRCRFASPDESLMPISNSNSAKVKCEDSKRFVFLSIFKWEYRKGWDILLQAYWQSFTPSDDVLLVIHSYLPSTTSASSTGSAVSNISQIIEDYAREVLNRSLSDLAPVYWVSHRDQVVALREHNYSPLPDSTESKGGGLTREEMRQLFAAADAFALPTRGEGWGLPIAEAMSMALPVIATNYSGPTAFIDDDNAYPLSVEKGRLDEFAYAIPRLDHLITLLRQVIRDSTIVLCESPSLISRTVLETAMLTTEGEEQLRPLQDQLCSKYGDTERLTVAKAKGILARVKMQSLTAKEVVRIMQERLKIQAERRGWKF
eukprot:gene3049-3328_t